MASNSIPEKCCVYWLYDETCSVPENDGYVGVTNNLQNRLAEHRYHGRTWVSVEVLFVGTREECTERELGYRPHPNIGWNVNSGGTFKKIFSEETKERIGKQQRGRKRPDHGKKMREIHARRSPEEKAKLAKMYGELAIGNRSRKGQRWSESERTKHAERIAGMAGNKWGVGNKNWLGKHLSPEHRAKLSAKAMGNKKRLGAKLSEATKAKISASHKRRFLTKQVRSICSNQRSNYRGSANCGLKK